MDIATRHTRVALDDTLENRTINGGNPIMVCGMKFAELGVCNTTVDYTDANGTIIGTVRIPQDGTIVDDIAWLADEGLILPSGDATTIVTVRWRPDT